MIAVLMPITWPVEVDQRAAGVARVDRGVGLQEVGEQRPPALPPPTARPRAESTPVVTVLESPNGLPIATTVSPIRRLALLPSGVAGSPLAATLSTARSASRSEPSTVASSSRPSSVVTRMRDAPSMTCSLVTTRPEGSMISPEPSDWLFLCRPPPKKLPKNGSTSRTIDSAEMLTTEGETRSTTATTGVRRGEAVWAAAEAGRPDAAQERRAGESAKGVLFAWRRPF